MPRFGRAVIRIGIQTAIVGELDALHLNEYLNI